MKKIMYVSLDERPCNYNFANFMLDGDENINLVTPTHYVTLIIKGIKKAKEKGLNIPIVYNTSGYESIDTIKELDGIIDVYLTDLKYYDDKYARKYSNVTNYFSVATKAIDEMYKQVGKSLIKNNLMKRGIIVRLLLLPGLLEDTKKIVEYLYKTYEDKIYISIMNQYTPIRKTEFEELNQTVKESDYEELINYAYDLGIRNAFVQEGGAVSESFVPKFDKRGV